MHLKYLWVFGVFPFPAALNLPPERSVHTPGPLPAQKSSSGTPLGLSLPVLHEGLDRLERVHF